MAGAHVEFTGDASGAQAAAAAAQAAIDSVHGKTETVTLNVRVNRVGDVGEVAGAMDRSARASEQASGAMDRFRSSGERASGAMDRFRSSGERAAGASDRVGDSSTRASGGLDRVGGSADRSRDSLGRFTKAGGDAGRASRGLGESAENLGKALGGVGDGAASAGKGLASLSLGKFNSIASAAGIAGSALSTFGTVAAYSAAGSGLLTAAVGALGVAGVGALGGVGVAAGLAGGAMAAFAIEAHKDSARFGADMKQLGQAAHLGAQMISEPMAEAMVGLGRSLVSANNQLTPAGMAIATSLQEGFSNAAGVINRSSGSIVDSARVAAAGFAQLTGEAAPGVEAFLGQLPSLTAGAVSGLSQITSEFGRSAAAIEAATPAFNRMMGSAGGLGSELVRIGAGSMVPFAENMTSMLGGATNMAQQLAPAIKPSMQAFTDLANAGMGAIGSLAPEIAQFAGAVSANSGGIQQAIQGIGKGMLGMGEAVAIGVGKAGPSINAMGDAVQANKGDLADIVEGALGAAADVVNVGANVLGGASRFGSQAGRPTGPGAIGGAQLRAKMDQVGEALGGGGPGLFGKQPSGESAFDRITRTGGLFGGGGGGAPAPVPAPPSFPAMGPLAPVPAANPFAPLMQQAQQAQSAIPASMNSAMAQSRSAIQSASLAPAVAPGLQKMVQQVQDTAGPAASAGGNVGAAIGGGAAQGITKTETITNKLIRRHITLIEDMMMGAADAHSPSRRFKKIGGYLSEGLALGIGDEARSPLAATSSIMDELNAKAEEDRAAKRSRVTIRRRPRMARPDRAEGRDDRGGPPISPDRPETREEANQRWGGPYPNRAPDERGGWAPGSVAEGQWFGAIEQIDQRRMGTGEHKRQFFAGPGDPNRVKGSVFDKQTFGWNAKPGMDITKAKSMAELNSMIQSPLDGEQLGAMNTMQGWLDTPGLSRNQQLKGRRTQQNVLRGRVGAMGVAAEVAKQQESERARKEPSLAEQLPEAVGGPGGGGQSYLGRDRIAAVRQFAGLGEQSKGYGSQALGSIGSPARVLGASSALGAVQGLNSGQGPMQEAGGKLAEAGHKGYKKKDKQKSPSAVWADIGGDSVSGLAGGFTGSTGVATGAVSSLAASMQNTGNDRMLQVGFTWGENVATGVMGALKKADYTAAGLPKLEAGAMKALAGTGLLKAGSGAFMPKMAGNAPSRVTLQPIVIQGGPVMLDGKHVADIADQRFMVNLEQVTDSIPLQAR